MKKTLLLVSLLALAGLSACDDDSDSTGPAPTSGLVGSWTRSEQDNGLGLVNENVTFNADSSFVRAAVTAAGGDSLAYEEGDWIATDSAITVTRILCKGLSDAGAYVAGPCDDPAETMKYLLSGNTLRIILQGSTPPDTLAFTRR